MNTQNPAPTPRTDAAKEFHDCTNKRCGLFVPADIAESLECELTSAQAALTAKDAEIARLKADGAASAFVDMAIRAEKAEAELQSRLPQTHIVGVPTKTDIPYFFGTDEFGEKVLKDLVAERDQLRAEVEGMKQFFKDGRVDWDVLNGVIAKTVADAKDVYAENKRLGDALAAELENKERMTKALQLNADYWESAKASDAEGESLVESMRKLCRAAIDSARKAQP